MAGTADRYSTESWEMWLSGFYSRIRYLSSGYTASVGCKTVPQTDYAIYHLKLSPSGISACKQAPKWPRKVLKSSPWAHHFSLRSPSNFRVIGGTVRRGYQYLSGLLSPELSRVRLLSLNCGVQNFGSRGSFGHAFAFRRLRICRKFFRFVVVLNSPRRLSSTLS
jgi:hypothetical protein